MQSDQLNLPVIKSYDIPSFTRYFDNPHASSKDFASVRPGWSYRKVQLFLLKKVLIKYAWQWLSLCFLTSPGTSDSLWAFYGQCVIEYSLDIRKSHRISVGSFHHVVIVHIQMALIRSARNSKSRTRRWLPWTKCVSSGEIWDWGVRVNAVQFCFSAQLFQIIVLSECPSGCVPALELKNVEILYVFPFLAFFWVIFIISLPLHHFKLPFFLKPSFLMHTYNLHPFLILHLYPNSKIHH